jgi:hypothetical protein
VFESTCGACSGDGRIEEVRAKRLDELSSDQLGFMLEAWEERQPDFGDEQSTAAPGSIPNVPSSPNSF